MDPNEALEQQRDLTEELVETFFDDEGKPLDEAMQIKCGDLADSVQNLDKWLMSGGFLPEEWAARCNGGLLKRALLAQRVYEEALTATESFEGDLGMNLAYLLGSILKGGAISLDMSVPEEVEVSEFFVTMFPHPHPVWEYIVLENAAEERALG